MRRVLVLYVRIMSLFKNIEIEKTLFVQNVDL